MNPSLYTTLDTILYLQKQLAELQLNTRLEPVENDLLSISMNALNSLAKNLHSKGRKV